jgi:peptidoglycan/LPS O-acetylase OafA/YrhL
MVSVSMDAHAGLRGASALWVMLYHCVLNCKFPMDFQGSSLMPLFFMLSGFSLAVVYSIGGKSDANDFNNLKFYLNRFARVGPVYYFGYFLAFPLMFSGFGSMSPTDIGGIISGGIIISAFTSFFQLTPLLCNFLGSSVDGPGWTVNTLLFMWFAFPLSSRYFERLSDRALLNWIFICYWVQFALVFILFYSIFMTRGLIIQGLSAATMNPLSRFPVFVMGICGGILCKRHTKDPLKWNNCITWSNFFGFFPTYHSCDYSSPCEIEFKDNEANDAEMNTDEIYWSNKVFYQVARLLALTLFAWGLDTLVRYALNGEGIGGYIWLQALVPWMQLELIIALCRDKNNLSIITKVCKNDLSNWLGDRSMSIYLVHYPLIFYLCWAMNGKILSWPNEMNCEGVYSKGSDAYNKCDQERRDFTDARLMPVWGIPIIVVASMVLAHVVYHLIEVPGRKFLRM